MTILDRLQRTRTTLATAWEHADGAYEALHESLGDFQKDELDPVLDLLGDAKELRDQLRGLLDEAERAIASVEGEAAAPQGERAAP